MDLINSWMWAQEPDESDNDYRHRRQRQASEFLDYRRAHGNCYMVQMSPTEAKPMWEDEIDIERLKSEITMDFGVALDCPLCQPFDYRNPMAEVERRHICKIINPNYDGGFADKSGVYAKCACLSRGAKRERLKFRGRTK